jgi:hypothetical protein
VAPQSPPPTRVTERRRRRLLLPVAGGAVAAVSWLADSAREHDGPSRIDPTTASHVLTIRTPILTYLAQTLTFLGSEVSVGVLAVLAFAVLLVRRQSDRAAVFGVGIVGSAFLTVTIKLLVDRHRPGPVDRLGAVDTSYSFPSGHTLNSVVFLALAVWLLWPVASRVARQPRRRWRATGAGGGGEPGLPRVPLAHRRDRLRPGRSCVAVDPGHAARPGPAAPSSPPPRRPGDQVSRLSSCKPRHPPFQEGTSSRRVTTAMWSDAVLMRVMAVAGPAKDAFVRLADDDGRQQASGQRG